MPDPQLLFFMYFKSVTRLFFFFTKRYRGKESVVIEEFYFMKMMILAGTIDGKNEFSIGYS